MKWRLLLDEAKDAATNMAVDETLFRSALSHSSLPTVRLYTWETPSLSIGYSQLFDEVCNFDVCRELSIETVRRISGGRAVLHQHELTYCVTAASEGPFRGLSVREVYSWVTGAIRAALLALEIPVDPPPRDHKQLRSQSRKERPELPCLAVPTGHEITSAGRKLVGAAQKWTRQGFLQHGSILVDLDESLWRRATGLKQETDLGAVGINHLLSGPVDRDTISRKLVVQFEHLFAEPASSYTLSESEMGLAVRLARNKYSSPLWNRDRHPIDI